MTPESAADVPDDLERLRRRFEVFRNTRPGRCRAKNRKKLRGASLSTACRLIQQRLIHVDALSDSFSITHERVVRPLA